MNLLTILLCLTLLLVVVFCFTFLNLPGSTLFWRALQNSGHTLAFTVLAIVSMHVLAHIRKARSCVNILYVGVGLSGLGLIIELAQLGTGRGASSGDLLLNTAGIIGGCCFSLLTIRVYRDTNNHWFVKAWLMVIGCAALAWGLRWPAIYAVASVQRPSVPLLADFDNPGAHYFVDGNGSVQEVARHTEWIGNASRSIKVRFQPGRFPNVRFLEPARNWSTFSTLTFKVHNPSNRSVEISVRIDDQSLAYLDDDHMTLRQIVPPGNNDISLDLNSFRGDSIEPPWSGKPTFRQIHSFMVYVARNRETTTLYFDDFILD